MLLAAVVGGRVDYNNDFYYLGEEFCNEEVMENQRYCYVILLL